MSFTYRGLKQERQWKATTGLKATQFYRLSKDFGERFEDIFGESLSVRQDRSSQESAFRSYEDLLFFLLFSLKSGLTYDALGAVFGIDGSSAKRIQELYLTILKATLHSLGHMPKREFASVSEFQQFFEAEEELILDGTEQRIQKPQGYDRQKPFYSGKKKLIR